MTSATDLKILAYKLWTPARLMLKGASIALRSAYVARSEDQVFWTAGVEIADPQDFFRFAIDDPVTVIVNDESYAFIVDNKTITREGIKRPIMTLELIGPGAIYASPRATPITVTFTQPQTALQIAHSLIPTLSWSVADWLIKENTLSVTDADPVSIISRIAETVGARLRSEKDGSLSVIYRFPTRVSQWPVSGYAATLTDNLHNLSAVEGFRRTSRFNKFYIGNVLPPESSDEATGELELAIDTREFGLNLGKSAFYPEDTVYLLVKASRNVDLSAASFSSSTEKLLSSVGAVESIEEEFVAFNNVKEARLSEPAALLISGEWVGRSLGPISMGADELTLYSEQSGVGVCKVRYLTRKHAYSLNPFTTQEEKNFFTALLPYRANVYMQAPVIAMQVTDPNAIGIVVARGDGLREGPPVIDELITNEAIAVSRGQAVLDEATEFKEVTIRAVFVAGVYPGCLVRIADAFQGATWTGKVTTVEHRADSSILTTSLTVLKP